jgi:tRNA threonylcarbamoyladenosine biosynthesis protein TsaE
MDLYRLESTEEIEAIGVDDYLYGDGVCLIEWAERLGPLEPDDAIIVRIGHTGPENREITINGIQEGDLKT